MIPQKAPSFIRLVTEKVLIPYGIFLTGANLICFGTIGTLTLQSRIWRRIDGRIDEWDEQDRTKNQQLK